VLGRTADGEFGDAGLRDDVAPIPGLLVVRPDGGLFFGNADRVRHAVADLAAASDPRPRVVCLVLSSSYHLGLPVLDALGVLQQDLHRSGVELWLAGVPSPARPQLNADDLAKTLGPGRIWPSAAGAADGFIRTG
jgi:MFS superfamily sulfate permease-like transporter